MGDAVGINVIGIVDWIRVFVVDLREPRNSIDRTRALAIVNSTHCCPLVATLKKEAKESY